MKIGIWLKPNYAPTEGGGFSYYDRLITGIDNYTFTKELEICYITTGNESLTLKHPIIRLSFSHTISSTDKLKLHIPVLRSQIREKITVQTDRLRIASYIETLKSNGIRLIFYPTPYMCEISDFPFITTHWDIGHRSTFTFPEVAGETTFRIREEFYNNILPKALLIFCESEAGKQELIKYTHINSNRIKKVPLFAGLCATHYPNPQQQQCFLQKYNLKENKYFYYPAQFWAHKNHHTLLQAFLQVTKIFPDYKLVFSGENQGNLNYIQKVVEKLHLDSSVVFAGFVSIEEVSSLYYNSTALVMPTLMGPTNMPPLEAMEIGCPIICSDLPGHREELGDAAIYINPLSAEDISQAMITMISHRDDFVKKINEQREKSNFNLKSALEAINTHLVDAVAIRECWE